MNVSRIGLAVAAFVCLISFEASAQTVQLPTFTFTGISTTVWVPDQGAVFLGGIDRAADGRNEFGVPGLPFPGFQNRGIGQDRSASSFWVTATIHDFDAMDRALLSTPTPEDLTRTFSGPSGGLGLTAAAIAQRTFRPEPVNLAGNWRPQPDPPPPVSDVAAEEAARATRRAVRAHEADDAFARGQQAEADGKPNVARIYYQMAVRRATGDLKLQAQARLEAISGRNGLVASSSK